MLGAALGTFLGIGYAVVMHLLVHGSAAECTLAFMIGMAVGHSIAAKD